MGWRVALPRGILEFHVVGDEAKIKEIGGALELAAVALLVDGRRGAYGIALDNGIVVPTVKKGPLARLLEPFQLVLAQHLLVEFVAVVLLDQGVLI